VPNWIKYVTIAFLAIAGISWLFPQYEKIGIERHDVLGGFTTWTFGTLSAGGGIRFVVWILIFAAMGSLLFIDKPDQPLGRFKWITILLIIIAMLVVLNEQSALSEPNWIPIENRSWVDIRNDSTGAFVGVWIGLCAGLLGAASALYYSHFHKATPEAVAIASTLTAPIQQAMPSARPEKPQQPPSVQKSVLEQKLDEYDRLRAAGKISDDELATLRQRALFEQ
jgi:hypothetical protein